MSDEARGEQIDLTKCSIQQLDQLKGQMTQELGVLQESLNRLKMVQQSFVSSETSLEQIKSVEKNKEILVPLTGSLYVPGRLIEQEKVLVDIGTGYYVNKSVDEAKKYFEKKIKFLTKQMEQLQPIIQNKAVIREDVMEVLQYKLQLQLQVQKAAATTGPSN
jgi:prefoldin alpha subunit